MKDKKVIIILILVLVVGVVGLTIAYFSNSTTLNNQFQTKEYGTTYTEEFVSPENWLPGTTTAKTIIAENTGEVDEAVRISLSESWTTHNNGTLNGWIHSDGTKSTHTTELELANDERVAILNLANTSDWTKVGNYYYYNYKLAPGDETSSFLESVTFNAKTKLDDTCVTTTSGSTKTITCDSSGDDYDNATYTLTVTVETVQYDKYNEAWNLNNSVTIANASKPSSGVAYLLSNAKNADGAEYNASTKGNMFKMTHAQTAQTPAQTEYRYIGDNPNNYVYFNCDSLADQSASTCEVWRIIGVFDVDDGTGNYEQRIKLVRGSALPDKKQWDTRTSELYPNQTQGKNEWVGSVMQTYLNDEGDYYTRTGTAANYGLKATAKNMISDAKYYLGGGVGNYTADVIYKWERGTNTFNYEDYCLNNDWDNKCITENYCENNPTDEMCNATRNTSWVGEVALMYPSDEYLVYANGVENECFENPSKCYYKEPSCATCNGSFNYPETGWIYNSNNLEGQSSQTDNWFVSPSSNKSMSVFSNYYDGSLGQSVTSNLGGVRPVLYLSSNVKIIEGTGEVGSPFKLGL